MMSTTNQFASQLDSGNEGATIDPSRAGYTLSVGRDTRSVQANNVFVAPETSVGTRWQRPVAWQQSISPERRKAKSK